VWITFSGNFLTKQRRKRRKILSSQHLGSGKGAMTTIIGRWDASKRLMRFSGWGEGVEFCKSPIGAHPALPEFVRLWRLKLNL
jgi:hypothetical protein